MKPLIQENLHCREATLAAYSLHSTIIDIPLLVFKFASNLFRNNYYLWHKTRIDNRTSPAIIVTSLIRTDMSD